MFLILPNLALVCTVKTEVNDVHRHAARLIDMAQTTAGECPSGGPQSIGVSH